MNQTGNTSISVVAVLVLAGIFFAFNSLRVGSGIKDGDEITSYFYAKGYDINGLYRKEDGFTNLELRNEHNTPQGVVDAILESRGGDGLLYHLSLHYWLQAWGDNDRSGRLFSLILMAFSMVLVFLLTRFLFGDAVMAGMAAFIFLLHPLIGDYSVETRPYAMGVAATLMSTYFYVRLLQSQGGVQQWGLAISYGIFSTLAVFVTYISGYILVVHALFALLTVRSLKKWMYLAVSGLIVIVSLGAWMKYGAWEALSNLAGKSDWWVDFVQKTTKYAYPATIGGVAKATIRYVGQIFGNNLYGVIDGDKMYFAFSIIFILCCLFLALTGLYGKQKKITGRRYKVLLPTLLIVIPIGIAMYTAFKAGHTVALSRRYATFIIPYAAIPMAFAIANLWKGDNSLLSIGSKVLIVFWVMIFLGGVQASFPTNLHSNFYTNHITNHYKEVGEYFKNNYREGDTLLYGNAEDAMRMNTYLKVDKPVYQRIDVSLGEDLVYVSREDTIVQFFDYGKYPDREQFRYFWPY